MRTPNVPFIATGLAAMFALVALPAVGQQAYRIVGPDGRVTYSDKPPESARGAAPAPGGTAQPGATNSAGSGLGALPFELRQVATKFPVTLYTGPNCSPCSSGRGFLAGRGIPFTEKTVSTNEDIEALQRLAGDASLPVVTIGGQQLKGFSDGEWSQFLDAAGYPKSSALPGGYRNPQAAPLVAVQRPVQAAPAPAPTPAPVAPPAPVPAPAPANPAGIRF